MTLFDVQISLTFCPVVSNNNTAPSRSDMLPLLQHTLPPVTLKIPQGHRQSYRLPGVVERIIVMSAPICA